MAIVKLADINRAETELVRKYLAMGLEMDINAMSGTQGEKGKIALADDKNVYFIYVNDTYVGDDFLTRCDVTKVIVERHDRDKRDLIDTWHTYWLGKGEVVEETIFYKLLRGRGGQAYTTDEKEARQAIEKHCSRYDNHDYGWTKWKKFEHFKMETAINIVKARTGRKRVARENIIGVEKRVGENTWKISYMFSGKTNYCIVSYEA